MRWVGRVERVRKKCRRSFGGENMNEKDYLDDLLVDGNTGLFNMIVGVLTTCHTHTSDSSICIFLFNRTTLQLFVTYLTGALYVHHL